jgi:UDP-N-acetylmuramoylalanine--D-glutamate ligase
MLDELREFTGLPHRAQWVADPRWRAYINDSKGTNVVRRWPPWAD